MTLRGSKVGWTGWRRRPLLVLLPCVAVCAFAAITLAGSAGFGLRRAFAESGPQAQPARGSTAHAPDATLRQLMRGIMFPDSNIIFAGQLDVSKIPPALAPDKSTDLVTSMYGGWQAVENASLALAESTDLLLKPGRVCADGKPVPVENADFLRFAGQLHDAAMGAYKAAQAKSTDDMLDAADGVAKSCQACHNVYGSNRAGQEHCVAAPRVTRPAPQGN